MAGLLWVWAEMRFQSAPLTKARGDRFASSVLRLFVCFNPLPSQKQGETLRRYMRGIVWSGFNPLPSQKQGETGPLPGIRFVFHVSIRSPHKSKGRLDREVRTAHGRAVSIRSPHKSKGRQMSRILLTPAPSFQSAPLTKARGDIPPASMRAWAACFNPLPSQKQGETSSSSTALLGRRVSIRSPHKSKGRLVAELGHGVVLVVSIRSPHKSKGRLDIGGMSVVVEEFQSAPLTKARGDRSKARSKARRPRFNPLPSQKQGET